MCLTQENKNNPWILFEAGALAKGLADTRVCTFLIDLNPTDIQPPLSMFNATMPDKSGLWLLAQQVNNSLKERALDQETLQTVFDTYWPQFENDLHAALEAHPQGIPQPERSQGDMLAEILQTTRGLSMRIDRVEIGLDTLDFSRPQVAHRNQGILTNDGIERLMNDGNALRYQAERDGSVTVSRNNLEQAIAKDLPMSKVTLRHGRPSTNNNKA